MKKDFVLDRRDRRVADVSGFNAEILCGRPRSIPASIKSNTSCQWPDIVATLNCAPVALWSGDGRRKLAAPIKGI